MRFLAIVSFADGRLSLGRLGLCVCDGGMRVVKAAVLVMVVSCE